MKDPKHNPLVINPATGLPMVGDSNVDVQGNLYGFTPSDIPELDWGPSQDLFDPFGFDSSDPFD